MNNVHMKRNGTPGLGILLFLYLLGIFMGAIDTGIVTPARTLIQGAMGVDERTGIWMITIYTLAYAAIIPISGKLADRFGRKRVYLASIGLFGLGSWICAFSASTGQFWILLLGRVVQALGGGGIMPVATAEFGTTFPPEKRGMALGLVGGVYGIANILGSTAGSAILDLAGTARWDLLFMINVPIAAFIVIAGFFLLPNNKGERAGRIDWAGIPLLSAMVLALLYGLRNVDFFELPGSIAAPEVWPFLAAFAVLLPIFIAVERKASDPVLDLSFFTSQPTLLTLILGFSVGFMMMGMVFVPQFSENALGIASGSGGYFVAMLGLFAGLSGPLSGSLVDRTGPKRVMLAGFGITLAGALILIFGAIPHPGVAVVLASLAVMGLGLGFTMGSPLNYMMLRHARPEESNSALATLSLMRSIGTAIAPAIMIGFLAHAGASIQPALMEMLPPVQAPTLINAPKVAAQVEALKADPMLKANPMFAAMLGRLEVPAMGGPMEMGGGMGTSMGEGADALPPEMAARLKSADVTTIVDRMKELSAFMFDRSTPAVIAKIRGGLAEGMKGLDQGIAAMEGQAAAMGTGRAAAAGFASGKARLVELRNTMAALDAEIEPAFAASRETYLASLEAKRPELEATFRSTLNDGFRQMYITVAVVSVAAALILSLYRPGRRQDAPPAPPDAPATAA